MLFYKLGWRKETSDFDKLGYVYLGMRPIACHEIDTALVFSSVSVPILQSAGHPTIV
ncbi:MAG TPA: hypothetical protein VGW09_10790 [Nitrososphaeraceae archaeon]|nr:hypothetical protein [Nitrososphaeraceae archaeon]